MKSVLYSVLPRPTHATRDGLAIRNYHLLAALAGEFRVRAFALAPARLRGCAEYPPGVEVEEIAREGSVVDRAAALAESALTGRAYAAALYRSRALRSRLARWVERERPAWIVAHSYHVASASPAGARTWVDFHNVDSEIWRRIGESAVSPVRRALARWQAPRVERMEREILRGAAGVSCVSGRDAGRLAELGGPAPLVVPNGVDLTRYAFRPEPASDELVFFVGDLTWPPNVEGIRWFLSRVWPALLTLRPSARAEILGRGGEALERRGPAGVAMLGEGGDTRPHWARAAVAVVPLLAGGGTRLKILEATACGVPVVSTRVGAEGLDLVAGVEIAIAEGAEEFASAVAALLADPEARRRQAAAARRRVEERSDWRRIGGDFARELSRRAAAE